MSKSIRYPAIPELSSRKDFRFYLWGWIVLVLCFILLVGVVILLITLMIYWQDTALNTCIQNGNTVEYCKSILIN